MAEAAHARAAGKTAVRERTLWLLELPGVSFRCLRIPDGYEVQVRQDGRWESFVNSSTKGPAELLRNATMSVTVDRLFGGSDG